MKVQLSDNDIWCSMGSLSYVALISPIMTVCPHLKLACSLETITQNCGVTVAKKCTCSKCTIISLFRRWWQQLFDFTVDWDVLQSTDWLSFILTSHWQMFYKGLEWCPLFALAGFNKNVSISINPFHVPFLIRHWSVRLDIVLESLVTRVFVRREVSFE